MADLTFAEVFPLFNVNFDTGKLFWQPRPVEMFRGTSQSPLHRSRIWNTKFAGKEAFTALTSNGYRCGRIFDRTYLAHRVIWLLATGQWADDTIDHINGDQLDNRLENLRAVSMAENNRNLRRPTHNTSGVVGVVWNRLNRKWMAQISQGVQTKYLGSFDKFEDAVAARKAAEIERGFHANHGRVA